MVKSSSCRIKFSKLYEPTQPHSHFCYCHQRSLRDSVSSTRPCLTTTALGSAFVSASTNCGAFPLVHYCVDVHPTCTCRCTPYMYTYMYTHVHIHAHVHSCTLGYHKTTTATIPIVPWRLSVCQYGT